MIKLIKESYGDLSDYLERHLDSWYGKLNELQDDIENLGLDVDEINNEYVIVHAAEPDGEDVYCKIWLGGTPRTISLETFEMLESVRRSKNVLRESDDKITARSFQELISKLEDHGYSCEHYYDTKYPESNWLYITKNGDPYEAEFYRYSDGEYELYLRNIHPTRRRNESMKRRNRNKLTEKSNFDTIEKAIDYYYPKWYYDEMSVNDIYDRIEKLGHSQDFIDAVIDGITDRYENEEDYELDDYDEFLDESNVVGMNNLSNLEIYNAKSTARSYISQGYDPDYDLDIITKNLKNEGRSDEYIELVLTKMRNFKNKEFSYRIDYYGSWDNGHVLHSFKKATLDRAEEDAKKASIKDPKNLYYVVLDDIMDPTTGWYYYKGKAYSDSDPELGSIKRTINDSKDDFDV